MNCFQKLEVFGSFGGNNSLDKVSSAKCGKRVTGVVLRAAKSIDDLVIAYQRAVAADPYNAKILRQLDTYNHIYETEEFKNQRSGNDSFFNIGCMLCVGTSLCPLCKFKNDFKYACDGLERNKINGEEFFLKDLVDAAMMGLTGSC